MFSLFMADVNGPPKSRSSLTLNKLASSHISVEVAGQGTPPTDGLQVEPLPQELQYFQTPSLTRAVRSSPRVYLLIHVETVDLTPEGVRKIFLK